MATWPNTLPQKVQLSGIGSTYEGAFRSFRPSAGRPIKASSSTRAYEIFTFVVRLKKEQYSIWWTFWRVDLQRGIDTFNFPHPILGTTVEVELVGDEPPRTSIVNGSATDWDLPLTIRVLDEVYS